MENQFLDLITEAVAERLIAGRKDSDDGFEEYDSLRNEHPDVFRYLTNCFVVMPGPRHAYWSLLIFLTDLRGPTPESPIRTVGEPV